MDKYSYEILSILKEQFEKIVGQKSFQISESGINISARQFYLKTLEDNLIEPMSNRVINQYNEGSGNELKDKMRALRSSSAMTYNLLGNHNIAVLGDKNIGSGIYTVEFEKQIHTLKQSLNSRPTNLDAFLYCSDIKEAVACEMKMTEWIFNRPGALRNAYFITSNYDDTQNSDVFIEVAKNLIETPTDYSDKPSKKEAYACFLRQYDAFQMFKHTLACYNACINKEMPIKKLTLINCVWELPSTEKLSILSRKKYKIQLIQEHNEFDVFSTAMEPVKHLFKSIGFDFAIKYYSFVDFIKILQLSDKTKKYLKRYTFNI